MKIEKIKTWLPVFSGFYNSPCSHIGESYVDYELDVEVDFRANYPEYTPEMPWEWITDNFWGHINTKAGDLAVAQCVVDGVEEYTKDYGVKSIKFECVRSPREYNFATDAIDVIIEVDRHKLIRLINENNSDWEDYLKDNYTSYDGFMSYHGNTVAEWLDDTDGYTNLEGHYLGAMLKFLLEVDHCMDGGITDLEYTILDEYDAAEEYGNAISVDADMVKREFETHKKYDNTSKTKTT